MLSYFFLSVESDSKLAKSVHLYLLELIT